MKKLSASVLLDVLSNADESVIREVGSMIEEINNAKSKIGVKQLLIEINTDDDFFVNGEYSYSGAFPIGNSFVGQVYLNALNNLTFTPLKGKEEKLARFLGYIRQLSVLSDLHESGRVCVGGNQTLEASVHTPKNVIHFGSVMIDLQA